MMDDKAALENIRKGGQEGFTVLYQRYVKSLRARLLVKYPILSDQVDDVLQEVFVKFLNSIPGFKEKCSVSTWLHTIAHSVAMDFIAKRPPDTVNIPFEGDTEDSHNAIDALLGHLSTEQFQQEQQDFDIQLCLERAFAQLERDGSKASLLNCLKALTSQAQGASIQEIAEQLGKNPDTTRRYLADCRTRLKQYQPIQRCRELLKGD